MLRLFSCPAVSNSLSMDRSAPDLPVPHHLPKFAPVYVHCINNAIKPSYSLTPPSFLPSVFPSIREFSNESAVCIRWPRYWSFSISASNEYSELTSLKIDSFVLLRSLLQCSSSKASILWCSAFLTVQPSQLYVTTGKIIALTIRTFVSRGMSLLLNTPSRFVTTFLPRSNRLWISWLQSTSTVILEPKKRKSVTTPNFSLSICYEVIGRMP